MRWAFRNWADLMTSNYTNYALLKEDDPYTECREWFWQILGEDDVYPKAFLEHLMQMVDDIDSGKVKTYPADEVFNKVKDIMDEVKFNDEKIMEDECNETSHT